MKKVLLTSVWCLMVGICLAQTIETRGNNGHIVDSTICFQYNENFGALLPSIREVTLATNTFGNITEKRTDSYDLNTGDWIPLSLLLANYDNAENLTQSIQQEWNPATQSFVNKVKTTFDLNAFGNPTEVIQQTWSGSTWTNIQKESYQYDAGPNAGPTLFLFQMWENGTWANDFKVFNSYDQNLLASTLFQKYINGEWVNGNRSFETYNNDDLLEQSRREAWNTDIEDWVLSSQVLYSYEGENNTEVLSQLWDNFNQTWVNVSLVMNTFNAKNLKTEEFSQNWINGAWVSLFRTKFQYNEEDNLTRSEGDLWINDAWRPQNACNLYWSSASTAITKAFENQIQCTLPNPFQTGKSITCNQLLNGKNYELAVFDMNGVQHFSKKITANNDLFINKNLSSGMYLLVVKNEDGMVFRQKLINVLMF